MGGSGGTAGSGGLGGTGGELPMIGSEEVVGGGIPGDWGPWLKFLAEGRTLVGVPAIFKVNQPQPGYVPPARLEACADESDGYCVGHSFAISLHLVVPDGEDPLQRRYFIGNPQKFDNSKISIVGVSEDSEHWLVAGSGTLTLYRAGHQLFSGQMSVELIDDDGKPARHFEATFGGGWYISCRISLDPPLEGQWDEGLPDDPFCQQFESWK